MIKLNDLRNSSRPTKNTKRLGRGIGSNCGKTCGRGQKGAGARSGYTTRGAYEGGQFRTFMKMPERGFSNVRFRKALDVVNLDQIEQAYEDGEVVSLETLVQKGFLSGVTHGIKVLGNGTLTKNVSFEVTALSKSAEEKLLKAKVAVTLV